MDNDSKSPLSNFLKTKSIGKLSGSSSNNRFDFQEGVSLEKIIEQHINKSEYIALFDYHEDFILFSPENNPKSAKFYQIKSDSKKTFTISRLTSKRKLNCKENINSDKKASILEKLFANYFLYEFNPLELYIITNQPFNIKIKDGLESSKMRSITLDQISEEESEKIKSKLSKENTSSYTMLEKITKFEVSSVPLDVEARDTYLKGKIIELIESLFPAAKYQATPIFLTIKSEILKRSNNEHEFSDIPQLVKNKGITKSQMTSFISTGIDLTGKGCDWDAIRTHLLTVGIKIPEIRMLKKGYSDAVLRINNGNKAIEILLKKIKKLVVDVEDKAQNLKELLEIVYLNLKVNLSNAEQALFTEEEIKGFILYEACKDW